MPRENIERKKGEKEWEGKMTKQEDWTQKKEKEENIEEFQ